MEPSGQPARWAAGDAVIRPETPPPRESVAGHYDELDPFYRELWGEHLHHGLWETGREGREEAAVALVDHVAGAVGLERGDRVCDLGCGYGAPAAVLHDRYGAEVTGITVSRAQHAVASRRAAERRGLRFLLRDWRDHGLRAESFDVVVAIESTEHLEDRDEAFREVRRVLRPGGRFVICTWLAAEEVRGWEVKRLLRPICREGRLAGLADLDETSSWLRRAGLDVLSVHDLTDRVRQTWSVCLRRTAARLVRRPVSSWSYLLDTRRRHRAFALCLVRIWVAYRTGALRYACVVSRRPT